MSEKHTPHAKLIERLKAQAEDVRRLCAELPEEAISRRMASAKLAKSRVNQSQSAIWRLNRTSFPRTTSRTSRMLTRDAPTSTTNITGFRA